MPAQPSGPGRGESAGSGQSVDEGFLLARLAGGDLVAFRTLVDAHLGKVMGLARRMLGDATEAEDVAQEAMTRLWREAPGLRLGAAGVGPWLSRVTANLCIDRLRAGRRQVLSGEIPDTPTPPRQEEALAEQDLGRRVNAALLRLPERQRQALTLFHYEGMGQAEIAGLMALSVEAVESLLSRARRTLRDVLEDEWKGLIGD